MHALTTLVQRSEYRFEGNILLRIFWFKQTFHIRKVQKVSNAGQIAHGVSILIKHLLANFNVY